MLLWGQDAEALASAVRGWATNLPTGMALLTEHRTRDEIVLVVRPRVREATSVEIRIGKRGDYGLYFGSVFAIEECPSPAPELLEILDAIREGHLDEWVWTWRGRDHGLRGELKLPGGRRIYDRVVGYWPFSRCLGTQRTRAFAAWSPVMAPSTGATPLVSAAEIAYPAFAVTRAGFPYFVASAEQLEQATSVAVKKGIFEGLRIFDIAGTEFWVCRADRAGRAPGRWGSWLVGNPVLRVELMLDRRGTRTLAELEAELERGIARQRVFFEERVDGAAGLRRELRAAGAIPELMRIVQRSMGA